MNPPWTPESEARPPTYVLLSQARAWLQRVTADGTGHECPTCDQFVKVYRRSIHGTSARVLIDLFRQCGRGFGFLPDVSQTRGRDETKMQFWGLIEEATEVTRPDGGRAGYWRVTELGEAFVRGETRVPKYALIYNNRLVRHEGDPVTIRDCLGTKFNYDELMAEVIAPPVEPGALF